MLAVFYMFDPTCVILWTDTVLSVHTVASIKTLPAVSTIGPNKRDSWIALKGLSEAKDYFLVFLLQCAPFLLWISRDFTYKERSK